MEGRQAQNQSSDLQNLRRKIQRKHRSVCLNGQSPGQAEERLWRYRTRSRRSSHRHHRWTVTDRWRLAGCAGETVAWEYA